jgi:type II secretory pathway pseudopilin PulG
MPLAKIAVKREKEIEFQRSLRLIREAIDEYKRLADEKKIDIEEDSDGYPPNLEILVKGVELKVDKRFANFFSGNFTYTWLVATGVSSDENQGALAQASGLPRQPLKEIPLDWDERQTVTGFVFLSDPGNWEVTFDYNYGSGTPYTPTFLGQKEIDPEKVNSGRLPSHQMLNLRGTKKYKLYGQEFRLFFEALNVFDKKEISTLGAYGAEYYTMTGDLGGAFVETDAEGREDLQPLHDPSVFGEGRWIRVGIGFDW